MIARLVHVNGPPAVGKSTIAARLSALEPLALNLDIDELRVRLGQWESLPESKRVARDLGFGLAGAHLRAGHDVVLPQLIARTDVMDEIAHLARDASADLFEVMLVCRPDELITRARATRGNESHPRDLVPLDELERQIRLALEQLEELAASRPATRVIDVSSMSPDDAVEAVHAELR